MKIDFTKSFSAFHKDFKTVLKYLLGPISDEILGCKGHTNAVHKKALLYHKFFCFDPRCKTLLKRSREAAYELHTYNHKLMGVEHFILVETRNTRLVLSTN